MELKAELMSVGVLIEDRNSSYEVPIYQRNYSWGAQEIEQLIDDVWAAAQGEEESYFLGNLIVAPKQAKPGTSDSGPDTLKVFEVIDGQQRLTTIHLLLKQQKSEINSTLTYESRRASIHALEQIGTDKADDGTSSINSGYRSIKDYMHTKDAENAEFVSKFKKYLLKKVQLVRVSLPAHTDLNRYFVIMNTRGQQLEQVDIVKARLMGYLRGDDVKAARACFAWVWEACADMNAYIQMSLAPRDTKLRSEVFGEGWDRLEAATFDELLKVREKSSGDPPSAGTSSSEPMSLDDALKSSSELMSLEDALKHYALKSASLSATSTDVDRFESPIKFASLLLQSLKVFNGDGDEDDGRLDDRNLIRPFDQEFKIPNHSSKDSEANADSSENARSDRVKKFAETLLRCKFILDNYIIKREYTASKSEDGAWSLGRLTASKDKDAQYPNPYDITGDSEEDDARDPSRAREAMLLQSMLRITYTSPRTMHWMTALLRRSLPTDTTQAALNQYGKDTQEILRTYARKKVREAYPCEGSKTGFGIQRIVFTYLDYLLATGTYKPSSGINWKPNPEFRFVYRTSIEHFFPQHPNKGQSGWDAVAEKEGKDLLGNLALVSVSANSKFSNSLPITKATYKEIRQQSTKLDLMATIAEKGTWDTKTISDHHAAMEKLLKDDLAEGTNLPSQP